MQEAKREVGVGQVCGATMENDTGCPTNTRAEKGLLDWAPWRSLVTLTGVVPNGSEEEYGGRVVGAEQ